MTGWPVRSVAAGAAGTAVLTAWYGVERRVRRARGPVDYDDSLVPGQIVVSILHLGHVTGREEGEIGLALRWTYGSGFGVVHGVLRRRGLREPLASAVFGGVLISATLSLFPLLGRTPPPWRWPRSVLLSELGSHAAYVAAVAAVDSALAA